ncbi:MAG TPA: hypothetical protein VK427_16045, partial [Kofleriaceae bacterium]|nr:hypothetical protein [Kofleriaceae bacterium]
LVPSDNLDRATVLAQQKATLLIDQQLNGVAIAAMDITSYQAQRLPPTMFDEVLELAFMMGVSGIAGVVARYLAQNLAGSLAQVAPAPGMLGAGSAPVQKTSEQLGTLMTDGLKEGLKISGKIARKHALVAEQVNPEAPRISFSSNRANNRVAEFLTSVRNRGELYHDAVTRTSSMLRSVEPAQGNAAMRTLALGLAAASDVAPHIQQHALVLEWVRTVARHANGTEPALLPDGSEAETTKLDGARSYGAETWVSDASVPKRDGVLDIHVDLPVGTTPIEMVGDMQVKSASIMGISQEIADKLVHLHLAHAGIPIRLVVSGHPALITRDELGRVRINGYLLTKDTVSSEGTPRWTEAHMHRGAQFLVDKVLSKTLWAWGVEAPVSNDATGRTSEPQ